MNIVNNVVFDKYRNLTVEFAPNRFILIKVLQGKIECEKIQTTIENNILLVFWKDKGVEK